MGLQTKHFGYVPALDGLRAVAVLAVMLMHTTPSLLPSGFVGVDVFFVLSGFLITSILLKEVSATGRIDLPAFYWRRARRLLPALFVVLAFCTVVTVATETGSKLQSYLAHTASVAGFMANWFIVLSESIRYDPKLVHLWSLSVEEQFYFVWPILIIVMAAVKPRAKTVALIAAAAILLPQIARLYLCWRDDRFIFYFHTEMRVDNLAWGAAAAGVLHYHRDILTRYRNHLAVASIAGLAVILWHAPQPNMLFHRYIYFAGFTVISISSVAIILACVVAPDCWVSKLLALAPMRAVGRISYSLYIWHIPIFIVLERLELPPVYTSALGFTLSFAVAAISRHVFEPPFAFWQRPGSEPAIRAR